MRGEKRKEKVKQGKGGKKPKTKKKQRRQGIRKGSKPLHK